MTYQETCPDCGADDSSVVREESQAFGSERRQCRRCGRVWDVVESTFALPTETVRIGGFGFPVISAEAWFAANPEEND